MKSILIQYRQAWPNEDKFKTNLTRLIPYASVQYKLNFCQIIVEGKQGGNYQEKWFLELGRPSLEAKNEDFLL